MSDNEKGIWRVTNPIAWGICATIALAIIVVLIGVQTGPDGIARFREFASLPSNAVGDTLAGIFAPLAFIWIVVTVFLQSHELKEQRIELGLTRDELTLAREAQEKQLSVMQKQADIFETEQRQRDQSEAAEVVEALLRQLVDLIVNVRDELTWDVLERHADGTSSLSTVRLFEDLNEDAISDDALRSHLIYFTEQVYRLRIHLKKNELSSTSSGRRRLEEIFHSMKEVVAESNKLSKAQVLRVERFQFLGVLSTVESLLVVQNYWSDAP